MRIRLLEVIQHVYQLFLDQLFSRIDFDLNFFSELTILLIGRAFGAGVMRINLMVFGFEQVKNTDMAAEYVDKLLITLNIVGFIDLVIVTFIPDGPRLYPTLHAISICMLFICALLFLAGRRYFIYDRPYDSVLVNIIPVYRNAFHTWLQDRRTRHRNQRKQTRSSSMNILNVPANETHDQVEELARENQQTLTFLDYAKVENNGNFLDRIVDDVKLFRNAILILIFTLPLRITYAQVRKAKL